MEDMEDMEDMEHVSGKSKHFTPYAICLENGYKYLELIPIPVKSSISSISSITDFYHYTPGGEV